MPPLILVGNKADTLSVCTVHCTRRYEDLIRQGFLLDFEFGGKSLPRPGWSGLLVVVVKKVKKISREEQRKTANNSDAFDRNELKKVFDRIFLGIICTTALLNN